LPLVGTLEITETKSGRPTHTLHTLYRPDDGSYLAFFEACDMPTRRLHPAARDNLTPIEFKLQHPPIPNRAVLHE
jgi:hypothetical protein